MKRSFVLCLIAASVIISAFSFLAFAEEPLVFYISDSGKGEGLSADSPTSELSQILSQCGGRDAVVYVVGRYSLLSSFRYNGTEPSSLTIVGCDASSELYFSPVYFVLPCRTEIRDITVRLGGSYAAIVADHNHFILGEGVSVEADGSKTDGKSFFSSLSVVGGSAFSYQREEERGRSARLDIKSGSLIYLVPFSFRVKGDTISSRVTVGENAEVCTVAFGTEGAALKNASMSLSVAKETELVFFDACEFSELDISCPDELAKKIYSRYPQLAPNTTESGTALAEAEDSDVPAFAETSSAPSENEAAYFDTRTEGKDTESEPADTDKADNNKNGNRASAVLSTALSAAVLALFGVMLVRCYSSKIKNRRDIL